MNISPLSFSPVGEMLVAKTYIEKQARRQMDVEIAFSPDGLSARLLIINIRFYESELNPNRSLGRSMVVFNNCLLSFAFIRYLLSVFNSQ